MWYYAPVNENLEYLTLFARFPFSAHRFFKRRLTLQDAERIVRDRMEHRTDNFLRVVASSVYGNPRSPYLALLKLAGCQLGDLRALVQQKGLEGALIELRAAGVYVTFEEFKGRKPIERHGQTIPVTARDFDNPFARRDFATQSSGSTGLATLVHQDLDDVAATAPDLMLSYSAYGVLDSPIITWAAFLPGPGFRFVLQSAYMGRALQRWFAPNGWRESKYWLKYSAATLYMLASIRALGYTAPTPEIVPLDQAIVIARCLDQILKMAGSALLLSGVSRALRVCLAAEEAGIDLTGTVIRCAGEPVTEAKEAAMRRVGAQCRSGYVMTETGAVALACANPAFSSGLHLLKDAFALVTHEHTVAGQAATVRALNLTSLLDTAPKVLLNTQMDDYAIVEERTCGCALEALGYGTHIREIRSYSKLVGETVTLIGNEMLHILESVLPTRFGGSALDYQLLEQEDAQGFTRLFLVISPRVQIADERAVIEVMHTALRDSTPMADAARVVWQQAQTIQIQRSEPVWTASAKYKPLHIQRRTGQ